MTDRNGRGRDRTQQWDHNLHYHPVVTGAVPPGCGRALDVGCGQGALTRRLRPLVAEVTGLDRDRRSVELARAHPGSGGIAYVLGDFLAAPFRPETFDLVASVASLHHMEAGAALRRMADLLRPGGTLVVIGLAREGTTRDLPLTLALLGPAVVGNWAHRAGATLPRGGPDASPAFTSPIVWPPPLTSPQMRRLAGKILPGARFRRRLYWRYSLVWEKPR